MAGTKRGHEADDNAIGVERSADAAGCGDDAMAALAPRPDEHPAKRAKLLAASPKRRHDDHGQNDHGLSTSIPAIHLSAANAYDYFSPLSDELLVRILRHLSITHLLAVSQVSRRFSRLAADSQLWRALYYNRFVLPRALRIAGVRGGGGGAGGGSGSTLAPSMTASMVSADAAAVDWKRQYKLRHNWARGTCAVEELRLGGGSSGSGDSSDRSDGSRLRGAGLPSLGGDDVPAENGIDGNDDEGDNNSVQARVLVKVADGIAVTADHRRGLRVWELKTRSLIVGARLSRRSESKVKKGPLTTLASTGASGEDEEEESERDDSNTPPRVPTSLAVDGTGTWLDIAVGLQDGGFSVWRLDLPTKTLACRFAHNASSNGALIGISYAHPFVLTATDAVLVSLYVFGGGGAGVSASDRAKGAAAPLRPPILLTSLGSHTSRLPLTLSIRKLASRTVASIAYTFASRQGWSIGMQDLHIKQPADDAEGLGLPKVIATRLAFTRPVSSGRRRKRPSSSMPSSPKRRQAPVPAGAARTEPRFPVVSRWPAADGDAGDEDDDAPRAQSQDGADNNDDDDANDDVDGGPTTLCYTHPYLLATLPDNTLLLHLCTSNAASLVLSGGIRLWGHTSGISDAEITSRGKAVSVSIHGDEMRVWDLEGRPAAEQGRSVTIRPTASGGEDGVDGAREGVKGWTGGWNEQRYWVGFDDEMVIVLKDAHGGRESLMVYDFT